MCATEPAAGEGVGMTGARVEERSGRFRHVPNPRHTAIRRVRVGDTILRRRKEASLTVHGPPSPAVKDWLNEDRVGGRENGLLAAEGLAVPR